MQLSPDESVLWQWGPVKLTATLLFTWAVMTALVLASWVLTRRLRPDGPRSRVQGCLEVLILGMRRQVEEVVGDDTDGVFPFIGTLFLFIATSNLCSVMPFVAAPTGSMSTTAALAATVFVAVPVFGISRQGVRVYLHQYVEPNALMLPFNILGELSRTVALAVRLFGNVMSGAMLGAILLVLVPLFVPVLLQLLGLLTGLVQAYVFAILALVYVGSALRAHDRASPSAPDGKQP